MQSKATKDFFIQLRQRSKIHSFLPHSHLEKVTCAFILSILDYCSLYTVQSSVIVTHRQQLTQNATTRLLTSVLAAFRWLPVSFRINLKILLPDFKRPTWPGQHASVSC